MLSGKYINLDEVIAGVIRDTGMQEEIPWDSCVVWAFEAVNFIGANNYYLNRYQCFEIENYRVKLPCDFHLLQGILINGCMPVYNTEIGVNIVPKERLIKHSNDYDLTHIAIVEGSFIDINGNEFLAGFPDAKFSNELSFSINDSFITCNIREGILDLFYLAIPTDERGFPLIPEDTRYTEAIKKYLIYKLDHIQWRRKKLDSTVYQESEKNWFWFCASAHSKAMMPDIHLVQAMKNSLMRLKSDDNLFYKQFTSNREHKYIK